MADVDPAANARAARRAGVPTGSAATLAGIVVSGAGGFGSLAVATRAVEPGARGSLAAAWTLVFLVGPAVFYPLEQALSGRLLGGGGTRRVSRVAAAMVLGLAVPAAAAAPLYVDDLLDGRTWLLVAVVLSLAGYAAQHVLRARLVAARDFGGYGLVLGLDGALRLAGCLVAAAAGAEAPEAYVGVVAAAPLVATLACALRRTPATADGDASVGGDTARLVAASLCANVVVGAGPAVLKLLVDDDAALVSSYLVMVSLTRVPLLLGQALLAPLLAGLAGALADGRPADYRRTLRGAVGAVAGLGAVTTAAFALVAPALVPVLFGRHNDRIGAAAAAVLAGCAVTFLVAQLFTQALVAQGRTAAAAYGWLAALAIGAVALALWPGALGRVLAATLTGCLAGCAVLGPPALAPRQR